MIAIAEVSTIPIGAGPSVRTEIMKAYDVLKESGMRVELHRNGTNIEGPFEQVLEAVRKIHLRLHEDGVPRLHTSVEIETRTDK